MKELILKKDLVIPAGTRLTSAPNVTKRYGGGHFETILGLCKDSSGSLVYCIDDMDPDKFDEWFVELKNTVIL